MRVAPVPTPSQPQWAGCSSFLRWVSSSARPWWLKAALRAGGWEWTGAVTGSGTGRHAADPQALIGVRFQLSSGKFKPWPASPLDCPRLSAHVIQRGNNRQTIFRADKDYQFMLDLLLENAVQV